MCVVNVLFFFLLKIDVYFSQIIIRCTNNLDALDSYTSVIFYFIYFIRIVYLNKYIYIYFFNCDIFI